MQRVMYGVLHTPHLSDSVHLSKEQFFWAGKSEREGSGQSLAQLPTLAFQR